MMRSAAPSPARSASNATGTRSGLRASAHSGTRRATPAVDGIAVPGRRHPWRHHAESASTALSASMTVWGSERSTGDRKLPAALRDPRAMDLRRPPSAGLRDVIEEPGTVDADDGAVALPSARVAGIPAVAEPPGQQWHSDMETARKVRESPDRRLAEPDLKAVPKRYRTILTKGKRELPEPPPRTSPDISPYATFPVRRFSAVRFPLRSGGLRATPGA